MPRPNHVICLIVYFAHCFLQHLLIYCCRGDKWFSVLSQITATKMMTAALDLYVFRQMQNNSGRGRISVEDLVMQNQTIDSAAVTFQMESKEKALAF